MKRANIAAGVAALLVPAALMAQEGAKAPGAEIEGPEVVEPADATKVQLPPSAQQQPQQANPDGTPPEVYVVQHGDTLWDLSQRFLGNPWYWPKVWSYNPEIENPHWIYPGNTVRFLPSAEELPARVDEAGGAAEEGPLRKVEDLAEVTMGSFNGPQLTDKDGEDPVSMSDTRSKLQSSGAQRPAMRQEGMITQRELDDAGTIERSWAERDLLSTFDKVYVRFHNPGAVRVGALYSVFRTTGDVRHPVTGKKFGVMTRLVGTVRVTGTDSKLIAGVIEQCNDAIERGDFVGPLGAFVKQVSPRPNQHTVSGYVLASVVPTVPVLGEHHVVFLDKGSRDGVEEGNTFRVVRAGDPLYGGDARTMPEEEFATILVTDVKETASLGLVVRSIRELRVGDKVVMKAANAASASANP